MVLRQIQCDNLRVYARLIACIYTKEELQVIGMVIGFLCTLFGNVLILCSLSKSTLDFASEPHRFSVSFVNKKTIKF